MSNAGALKPKGFARAAASPALRSGRPTRALAMDRRKGFIVNLSSFAGLRAAPALGYYNATKFSIERHRSICAQLREQHRKLGASVLVASTNLQFTANAFDKRPNNPHSQSFAGRWIKSFRQSRAVIRDRQRVALSRIRLQPDRDPACAIFGRVRDQFVDNETERNAGDGR